MCLSTHSKGVRKSYFLSTALEKSIRQQKKCLSLLVRNSRSPPRTQQSSQNPSTSGKRLQWSTSTVLDRTFVRTFREPKRDMMSLFISHDWKRFGSRPPQKSPFWITHEALQADLVDSFKKAIIFVFDWLKNKSFSFTFVPQMTVK